jgi:hypothetical protein
MVFPLAGDPVGALPSRLTACQCGHPPDEHEDGIGCLHGWDDENPNGMACACMLYQVRK